MYPADCWIEMLNKSEMRITAEIWKNRLSFCLKRFLNILDLQKSSSKETGCRPSVKETRRESVWTLRGWLPDPLKVFLRGTGCSCWADSEEVMFEPSFERPAGGPRTEARRFLFVCGRQSCQGSLWNHHEHAEKLPSMSKLPQSISSKELGKQ